ncbi:MAG: S8 family peptidase [Bacteroidetes bacterium]|nr:S8 family peptidase [Bacteroidota bacterium]
MKLSSLILLTLLLLGNHQVNAQSIDSNFVDGRIYVKVLNTSSINLQTEFLVNPTLINLQNQYGITKIEKAFQTEGNAISRVYRLEFNEIALVESFINSISAISYVEYAEKAPLYKVNYVPNDPGFSQLYHLSKIQAKEAWNIHKGESKVVIAIVDNGINLSHEDLVDNLWVNSDEVPNNFLDDDLNGYADDYNGYDAADRDGNPNPPANGSIYFGHGTHCAGIASSKSDNNTGIASIGFQAKIMAVKVSPNNSDGRSITAGYEGADYALRNGASVISMSFGGPSNTLTWQVLVQQAQAMNVILVASAGNEDSEDLNYPAAYAGVISVGATDQNDQRTFFSNYGSTIDVMAPGLSIQSTYFPGNTTYGQLSGTSMSCPMVAGLVSLIKSYNTAFNNDQIVGFLKNGCDNIDAQNPAFVGKIGSGRINAYRSLMLASGQSLGLENRNQDLFRLFPNPATNNLNIYFYDTNAINGIEIIDLQGKILRSVEFIKNASNQIITLDVSLFKSGIYFVRSFGELSSTQKFIVQ